MVFVDTGLEETAKIFASAGTVPAQIAVGSGLTTPSTTATTLEGEFHRETFSSTDIATAKQIKFEVIIDSTEANNEGSLANIGIFNAGTNGIMFAHATYPAINKDASLDVQYEYVLKFQRA